VATQVDLARQLLDAASNDELMARSLLPVEGVTDAGIGYHAQQALEKAIKAVLAFNGIKFPFTHSLEYLRDTCKESEIELPSTLDGMEELTPFAAAERYGSPTPIGLDRDKALAWASTAVGWAWRQIEPKEEPAGEAPGSDAPHP